MVQYVRNNFFAGEEFTDLADAQHRAQLWCAQKAGLRIHGTTCAQPAVMFADREAQALLAAPTVRYAVPVYVEYKVARDYRVQLAKALYSIPHHLRGQTLGPRGRRVGEVLPPWAVGEDPSVSACWRPVHRPG
jgi:hypothetical protein